MMGESDLLFKAGGQIGGEPGVVDGVRAKKGEHASAFGDAADLFTFLQWLNWCKAALFLDLMMPLDPLRLEGDVNTLK